MQTLVRTNLQKIAHPLLGISLLVLGNSYCTTLTTLQLHDLKVPPSLIGNVISAYFTGLIAGAFLSPFVIRRIGHTRTFHLGVFLTCSVVLGQALFVDPFLWMFFRFIAGVMLGTAVVVVESWIVSVSDGSHRTRIFAIYTFVYYGVQSLSQIFFRIDQGSWTIQYAIVFSFIACSFFPISSAIQLPPPYGSESSQVTRISELDKFGLLASFFAGALYANLYTVLPLFLSMHKMSDQQIGILMTVALMGGATLLYPICNLADRFPKSKSVAYISVISAFLSLALLVSPARGWIFSLTSFFLFGLVFSLYPVSLSLTVEKLPASKMVDGTALVLFGFGSGALVSPSVSTYLMQAFGAASYVYFLVALGVFLGGFILLGRFSQPDVEKASLHRKP